MPLYTVIKMYIIRDIWQASMALAPAFVSGRIISWLKSIRYYDILLASHWAAGMIEICLITADA